jgi:hypothetical protein
MAVVTPWQKPDPWSISIFTECRFEAVKEYSIPFPLHTEKETAVGCTMAGLTEAIGSLSRRHTMAALWCYFEMRTMLREWWHFQFHRALRRRTEGRLTGKQPSGL